MRSARSRVVRGLASSWMAMACAACVLWWCVCGTGMRLVLAGNGPGRDFLFALPGRFRPVPGISPVLDVIGVPDPAQWPPAEFPGVVAAAGVSRRAVVCCPARARDDGCLCGLLRHDRRARGPPFPAHFPGEEMS
jgi:hypothetical protein